MCSVRKSEVFQNLAAGGHYIQIVEYVRARGIPKVILYVHAAIP
jgi:hypothetical protein